MSYRRLARRAATLAAKITRLEGEVRAELASLPARFGFSSTQEFLRAVEAANTRRRRKRRRVLSDSAERALRPRTPASEPRRTFTWLSRADRDACIADAKAGMSSEKLLAKYHLKPSALALVRRKASCLSD